MGLGGGYCSDLNNFMLQNISIVERGHFSETPKSTVF